MRWDTAAATSIGACRPSTPTAAFRRRHEPDAAERLDEPAVITNFPSRPPGESDRPYIRRGSPYFSFSQAGKIEATSRAAERMASSRHIPATSTVSLMDSEFPRNLISRLAERLAD